MTSARPSDSYLCPHGFDKRSVHCARCADPAFDSARGCEVAKAAMHTMHSSTGGPTVMTDHIPPGTKPTGTSKTSKCPDCVQGWRGYNVCRTCGGHGRIPAKDKK